jgi:TonB family protein
MFDYAISQNQRQRPTNRILAACVASSVVHIILLLTIIQFPQLLQGGMLRRFRVLSLITNSLTQKTDDQENDWRTVAVLRPQSKMQEPSAEQLKKLLYDWSKKGSGNEAPPIRIRWGNEQKAALKENAISAPRIKQESRAPILSLPANESIGTSSSSATDTQSPAGKSADTVPGSYVTVRTESSAGKKDVMTLPPPGSPAKSETAVTTPPRSVAEGIKQPPETYKVFEDEQKAIQSTGSGFFDTKEFPLGEYANQIKERIKGKWNIPSHLQKFQGHTTVVFYIDKNGRYGNARIITSSGSSSFDIAALMAIIESDPFPPLPRGFPGNHIGAKFVLSWNEP